MERRIFHGSKDIIEHPKYGCGKAYNDYGKGFYCTESCDMAKEWAVGLNRDGYCNSYRLDTDGLRVLDLRSDEYY